MTWVTLSDPVSMNTRPRMYGIVCTVDIMLFPLYYVTLLLQYTLDSLYPNIITRVIIKESTSRLLTTRLTDLIGYSIDRSILSFYYDREAIYVESLKLLSFNV